MVKVSNEKEEKQSAKRESKMGRIHNKKDSHHSTLCCGVVLAFELMALTLHLATSCGRSAHWKRPSALSLSFSPFLWLIGTLFSHHLVFRL